MSADPGAGVELLLQGMRRIFLRNFRFDCSIGIHEFERHDRQRLLVNIDLYVDRPRAAERGSIEAVVDYDFLRERISALAASRHFDLQETLVEEIAAICLSQAGVRAARVSTEKPDVYPDCDAVGVEVFVVADRGPAELRR